MPQVMESERSKKQAGLNAESKTAAYKLLLGLLRRNARVYMYIYRFTAILGGSVLYVVF